MKDVVVEALFGDEVEVSPSDGASEGIKIHFYYGMEGETLYFTNQQAWELVNAIVAFLPEDGIE